MASNFIESCAKPNKHCELLENQFEVVYEPVPPLWCLPYSKHLMIILSAYFWPNDDFSGWNICATCDWDPGSVYCHSPAHTQVIPPLR